MAGSYTVTALAKGLRVLSAFSEQRRELRLVDVSELTGIPVATAFRLLKTLEEGGYVEQLEDGRFRPGPYVLSLGYAALQGQGLVEAATVCLKRLADETGETVNLGVLVGSSVLYLVRIRNTDLVTANLQVGSMLPAPCTSMGKLLLAYVDAGEVDRRITDEDLGTCRGPHAMRTLEGLAQELSEIRQRGWALQDEEVAHGLRSVAAPVRDPSGVVAAANLAVQASHWTRAKLIERFLPPLLGAAAEISRHLGYIEFAAPLALR